MVVGLICLGIGPIVVGRNLVRGPIVGSISLNISVLALDLPIL